MLKVSDAFNSAFAAPDRELRARVTIGKTVYDSDDLTSINYDSGAMTGEQFSIGSTYMNSAKITFSHLVEGLKQLDEVLVEFGVLKPDGAVEYVKMGTFIVDDKIQMDRNNNTTTIECMDRMTMLGGAYVSKLTYPARIKDVAVEIANMAGVKANETSFARLSENKINQPTGYTYRDAIGLIAQFQMGFALFDRDGLLDIRTLQDNSFKIDPNQYFLKGLVKNETFFKLNGISCTVVTTSKDENGNETSKTTVLQSGSSSGAQIKLANNVMTQDVLDRMYEALKFTNYYPFSLNWNGNPAVEAGDWLTVEDLQGNEFKVPNMSYTLTYNGGLTATSKADTSVSSPATYSYGGTISNIVNEIGGRESAEGNHIYEGTEDQEPTLSKEGDLWYKHVGPDTEEWIYKDGKWEFLTSTKTANDAADAAGKASKEAEEANKQANKAVDGANDAVAKAGFATDTATQAKSDAATAGQQAKDALTSAATATADAVTAKNDAADALTGAKKALTDSGGAMVDSAQARKDSATAKIQAANAATQANQAVTDASTAKADANTAQANATQAINDAATAKGQASNAIGQANTAIGNALTALNKVNGMSVGGTNLIPNSSTPQVLKRPADNPNYPSWVGRKIYSGLKNNETYTFSAVAKAETTDKSAEQWGIRIFQNSGDHQAMATNLAANTGKRQSLTFTTPDDGVSYDVWIYAGGVGVNYAPSDLKVVVTVSDYKLETGTMATDWSPAPEDVQQQFTDINGELSQKVSQTTYNTLAGTVDTVSTLAKQNQSTIGTLATKTSVDTVSKTATTAQTLAQQNATELLNKANSTTVDTLTQRVTTAESTLSQTATKAELALTNTDVDKLNDTVASQALDIAATADGLKLKADSSTVSDLDGRVTSLSGQLDVQSDLISAKVTASDVTGMLGNYATQTWTQSQIKITADGINSTLSSVKTTVDSQTTSINDLKTDSSGFKSQFTTVNNTLGKQTTDIGTLQATSKSLSASFDSLSSDNQTNQHNISQLQASATTFNSTLMTVQQQVTDSAVGTNLLTGTSNQVVQANSWNMQVADIKYDKSLGDNLCASVMINNAAHASDLVKGNAYIVLMTFDSSGNKLAEASGNAVSYNANGLSQYSISINEGTAEIKAYIKTNNMNQNAFYSCLKIEKGTKATDWCPNPADNASVTALSNKADQSQITQLSNQISLKADTTALNELKGTVDKQGSEITLNTNSIKLKADQSSVDTLKGTVDKQGSAIDVNTKAIALKANQSTVDTLTGRVSTAEGNITVQADQIAQTVSKTELTSKLNGYATQTWTQSQIKSTADSINLSVSKVQTNLDNLAIGGRNLVLGTSKQVVQANSWNMQVADIKYDKSLGETLCASVMINNADHASYLERGSANIKLTTFDESGKELTTVVGNSVSYNANGLSWCSISIDDNTASVRARIFTNNMNQNTFYSCLKIERGNIPTDWTPAPEDMVTVEKLSELQVTVNGIQGTVQNKADQSQITQLANDINLRVQKGDVVNQINISPEGILIDGKKVHITGQTTIDNAVIKDAMIVNVKADKITAGTLNAANVNVINLNANNITTGTIKGANLSMNLNTGEVLFQKGSIKSANGNLNLDISKGTMAVINEDKSGFYFEDGKLVLNDGWLEGTSSQPKYGSLEYNANYFTVNGLAVKGTEGVTIGTPGYNPSMEMMFSSVKESGIAIDRKHLEMGSVGPTVISSGNEFFMNLLTEQPFIAVGTTADGNFMTTDKPGSRISLYAEYVHIKSAYLKTASGSANVIVAADGALVRSTSASKYKTDIIRTNIPDYGEKLLELPTATWTDIAETKRYRDDPTTQPKPTRNFGMIAEDLADAGLEMLVVRGADGELEGINYDRIGPALIPVIAKLKNEVETLKQKIGGKSA